MNQTGKGAPRFYDVALPGGITVLCDACLAERRQDQACRLYVEGQVCPRAQVCCYDCGRGSLLDDWERSSG